MIRTYEGTDCTGCYTAIPFDPDPTLSYLREHLTENVPMEELCRLAHLSRRQLSARFKAETGFTVTEYACSLKIKKAQELLTSTDKSLLEISTYLGFSSQGYFQDVFKKYTSMTPGDYRKYNGTGTL